MPKEKLDQIFKSVGDLFNVLSNPDRLRIIKLLVGKEMDVHEIHTTLNISQSRTSQHLKLLKLNSLVSERKEGRHIYYSIKNPQISNVFESALQFQLASFVTDPELLTQIHELLSIFH